MRLPKALSPLRHERRWVVWRLRNGKKPPLQAHDPNLFASVSKPETWCSYAEARSRLLLGSVDGVGFVLSENIAAIDLDDCRDPESGEIDLWARKIVERADSYCQVTPSQEGLRVIGLGEGKPVHRVVARGSGKFEVYRRAQRYITITGDQLHDHDRLVNIDDVIDEFVPESTALSAASRELRIEPGKHDWLEVLVRLKCRGLKSCVTAGVPQGRRSDVIWKIGMTLREHGATPSEVACVLLASGRARARGGG